MIPSKESRSKKSGLDVISDVAANESGYYNLSQFSQFSGINDNDCDTHESSGDVHDSDSNCADFSQMYADDANAPLQRKQCYSKSDMQIELKKFQYDDLSTHIFLKTAQGTPYDWEHLPRRYLFVELMKPILVNESNLTFSKFFDKINRQMMMYKLHKYSITGKVYSIIKSI